MLNRLPTEDHEGEVAHVVLGTVVGMAVGGRKVAVPLLCRVPERYGPFLVVDKEY